MDLDVQRCPRCNRILSGDTCAVCAGVAPGSQSPPRTFGAAPPTGSVHPTGSGGPGGAPAPGGAGESRPSFRYQPPAEANPWWWRGVALAAGVALLSFGWVSCGDRPSMLGLATEVHGPKPSGAASVLFFLHGYGGSNDDVDWLVAPLRAAGLGDDVAVVFVEGPYSTGFGRHWGNDGAARLLAAERVRKAIRDALGSSGVAPERVFVAGFSQGAQMAAEIAAAEPRIGGLAALSACSFGDAQALPEGLSILVVHGRRDSICKFGVSSQLVDRLEKEKRDVTFVPFEDDHVIPPAAIEAVAWHVSGRRE